MGMLTEKLSMKGNDVIESQEVEKKYGPTQLLVESIPPQLD
jgi:hypothetical protein